MRDLYKGRWASFIGNAGVRALFSLDDYDTAKYWSDFIGGRIVATRNTQNDNYGLSQGYSVGEAMRPLLSPEEIMLQFGQGKMLVLPQGSRPVVTHRFAYWDDPALNGLWDDPRAPGKRPPSPPPTHPLGTAPPPPASPQAPTGGGAPQLRRPAAPPPAPAPAAKPAEFAGVKFDPIGGLAGVKINIGRSHPPSPSSQPDPSSWDVAKPDEPCPCGSGKLYERCHGLREVNRHVSGDVTYVMFSDDSVEVRSPSGTQLYPSLQALREAAATKGF